MWFTGAVPRADVSHGMDHRATVCGHQLDVLIIFPCFVFVSFLMAEKFVSLSIFSRDLL